MTAENAEKNATKNMRNVGVMNASGKVQTLVLATAFKSNVKTNGKDNAQITAVTTVVMVVGQMEKEVV